MKKRTIILWTMIFMIGITAGCSIDSNKDNSNIDAENIQEETIYIPDYYPFKKNTVMYYSGEGNEYAEKKSYFEYIGNNRAQQKILNPGTNMVSILEYKDGELKEIYSEEEFYNIENLLNVDEEKNTVILKEPLNVGASWTLPDGTKRTITGSNVAIETPLREFKALEVTTQMGEDKVEKDYYAKGIGLVASIYNDGETEIKTLLEKIEENAPLVQNMRFYYILNSGEKIVYTQNDIGFKTNEGIEKLFENGFKNPPSEKLISPISQNTAINKINFDKKNRTVKVDFSNELTEEMNAGSNFEAQIIKSIVNTFGDYYDADKIYISTEGVPYSTGHFQLREGEFFSVEEKDVEEFK